MAPVAKRVRAAGLLLAATLGLLLNSVPSLAGEHCPRTYRVGVSQIGYSYYLLDDGTPAGSSFDFYAELARRSGCTFEIDPLPRVRVWHEARLQHLDIISPTIRTAERDQVGVFLDRRFERLRRVAGLVQRDGPGVERAAQQGRCAGGPRRRHRQLCRVRRACGASQAPGDRSSGPSQRERAGQARVALDQRRTGCWRRRNYGSLWNSATFLADNLLSGLQSNFSAPLCLIGCDGCFSLGPEGGDLLTGLSLVLSNQHSFHISIVVSLNLSITGTSSLGCIHDGVRND